MKSKIEIDSIYNLLFKCLGIIAGLIYVRVCLDYFGKSVYGEWVVISSIISWLDVGDLGIGNGLRNEVTKLVAGGKKSELVEHVFVAIKYLIKKIGWVLGLFSLMILGLYAVNVFDSGMVAPILILTVIQTLLVIIRLSYYVLYGIQKSYYVTGIYTIISFFNSFVILFLMHNNIVIPLVGYSFIYGFTSLIPPTLVLIYIICRFGQYHIEENRAKELEANLRSNSNNFFVLQITSVILFSTDYVLVDYICGKDDVTYYSIINQVYNLGETLFSSLIIPLWSAFSFYYAKKNYKWLVNTIKKYLLLCVLFSIGVIAVSFMFNPIILVWLNQNAIHYSWGIIFVFSSYLVCYSFQSIFVCVMNGTGENRIQMIAGIISAGINIPLSILLADVFELGVLGVKLATLLCLLPSWIVVIIYSVKIVLSCKKSEKILEDK